MKWNDCNDVKEQDSFGLGTTFKVRMTIRQGGYNEDWTGGYASKNASGAVYLNVEFTVLESKYAHRKICSLIGLHSEKAEEWVNISRLFIRDILSSADGFSSKDNSSVAQSARRNGIGFQTRVDVEKDQNGNDKNAITADHKEYINSQLWVK